MRAGAAEAVSAFWNGRVKLPKMGRGVQEVCGDLTETEGWFRSVRGDSTGTDAGIQGLCSGFSETFSAEKHHRFAVPEACFGSRRCRANRRIPLRARNVVAATFPDSLPGGQMVRSRLRRPLAAGKGV